MAFTKILISEEFSDAIEKAFEKSKIGVQSITRAYYVYIDIKEGFSLIDMSDYRLKPFCRFLVSYMAKNKIDFLSNKLLVLVDEIITSRVRCKESNEELYSLLTLKHTLCFNGKIRNYATFARENRIVIGMNGESMINYVVLNEITNSLQCK